MNAFYVILLGLAVFLSLMLAWFALSSCLGDDVRAAWSGRRPATMPTVRTKQQQRLFDMELTESLLSRHSASRTTDDSWDRAVTLATRSISRWKT
jgi:hypothetical protein